jgi:glucokinase
MCCNITLNLDKAQMAILGIDVGGSKILARVGDGTPVWSRRKENTRHCEPSVLTETLVAIVRDAASAGHSIKAVGLGFPGLVDAKRGLVRSSVILDGWRDVPLATLLEERLRIPVAIDNDVNCHALAELALRTPPTQSSFLLVSVGTGIGAALVLDGRLHRGAAGLAGELGHVVVRPDGRICECGRRGCLGAMAGGEAIQQAFRISAEELELRAIAADPALLAALSDAAKLLGEVLASALNILDVGLVVLSGGLATRFILDAARVAQAEAFPEIAAGTRFELARAGSDGGAIGAAFLARSEWERRNG